ncbi:MAG: hypothetical protein A3G38_02835 [Omnitrophica WOR_2 bacterium RIFCSPLOWO2_12_FULL_51_8]|nr:MAG: hypothetical protein A3G38_02835 [Omnitrophica WOR_2 bacterium RIFCSPLOWO2_12_FULL_51_8]
MKPTAGCRTAAVIPIIPISIGTLIYTAVAHIPIIFKIKLRGSRLAIVNAQVPRILSKRDKGITVVGAYGVGILVSPSVRIRIRGRFENIRSRIITIKQTCATGPDIDGIIIAYHHALCSARFEPANGP